MFLSPKLFEEASSLTILGVPTQVMKWIQQDFALNPNSRWERVLREADLRVALRGDGIVLGVGPREVITVMPCRKEGRRRIETESYFLNGGVWSRGGRHRTTLIATLRRIDGLTVYSMSDGSYSEEDLIGRGTLKRMAQLEEIDRTFGEEVVRTFGSVVRRIYGRRAEDVARRIVDRVRTADGSLEVALGRSLELARRADDYHRRSADPDPMGLRDPRARENSLTALAEHVVHFEEAYSARYGDHLTVADLCREHPRERIVTAFVLFLYTGRIIEL